MFFIYSINQFEPRPSGHAASKPAQVIRSQRPLPGYRFSQLQQQFIFVFGQVAGERQRIGGMVGAEDDWLRRVEAADQSFLFFQYREVIRHLERFAVFALEFFLYAFVQIQLQRGEVGDGRVVQQFDGAGYMFITVLAAA